MAKFSWKKEAIDLVVSKTEKRLLAIGFQIESEIKRSMVRGAGSIYARGKKVHQASAPGYPPAVDTGRLRASISTNWSSSGLQRGLVGAKAKPEDGVGQPGPKFSVPFRVVIGSNVAYAAYVEFGTKRMAARPYLRPAFDKYKGRVTKLLAAGTVVAPRENK
jgi:HK97 gp10 family phage protein